MDKIIFLIKQDLCSRQCKSVETTFLEMEYKLNFLISTACVWIKQFSVANCGMILPGGQPCSGVHQAQQGKGGDCPTWFFTGAASP